MTQETFELIAEVRTDMGKGASRRLRHAGQGPGLVYGGGQEPTALVIDHEELLSLFKHDTLYT